MPFPATAAFDSTLALLKEGYDFIPNRCKELRSDAFTTRRMLYPVTCLRGEEAAEMFYQPDRFSRQGAMPQITLRLLQDKGSVQQMQGPAQRHRKAMFSGLLLGEHRVRDLVAAFRTAWRDARRGWSARNEIILFDEIFPVLTKAVAGWTGLPEDQTDVPSLSAELTGMIDNAGSFGVAALAALMRRRKTERWFAGLVVQVRNNALPTAPDSPLSVIASHLDHEGRPLDPKTAAVELINLLRPVVAVGRYLVFTAMALEDNAELKDRFARGDESKLEAFVEEVRRVYPFFPFVGGRATSGFRWRDHDFRQGDWVLLDLYGTNRDPARFVQPERIDPRRAVSWKDQGWASIPQGGGDLHRTHRCPGEAITVALMMETVRQLTRGLAYTVPAQDLTLSRARIPTRPPSGFRMAGCALTLKY